MEERIIVLALCSFSRVALFSEVVMCSFSWILFLTARLGGSFKLCAHPGFYLHEESSVEQEVAKFTRDSLVVFSEKAVRKIYAPICFQSRSNWRSRNVLRLSLRYMSSETDVGADNAGSIPVEIRKFSSNIPNFDEFL